MVKKIFSFLIVAVLCVLLGAAVINVIFPNTFKSVVNATEGMIYNATGISMDFNGDGVSGKDSNSLENISNDGKNIDSDGKGTSVEGFNK